MAREQDLVAQARRGEREACRLLVERYEDLIAATVTGMLGASAEADDVGQETFVRFFQQLDRYRGDGGVAPYLTRIAVNLSLNALERRRRRRWLFLSRDEAPELPEPETDDGSDFDRREIVHRALQHLDPNQRAVVVLRLIDGFSTAETAELLDIPIGTVLSRLARAQKKLKKLLEPYLADE
jgi:RNA polymerase sigma-70 factor, ECF subfamily